MTDANQKKNGPQVIGLEVWTGHTQTTKTNPPGRSPGYQHPTAYYSITNDEGIVEIGQDGYPGGTYWIRYEDGTTHAYLENAVRRVVLK